jgi:hypothetical protein
VTVIDIIAEATGLNHGKAEIAAGAILGAIKLSAPHGTFEPIEKAIPDWKNLILGAGTVIGGGRTGEIIAMVSELKTNAGVLKLAGQLIRAEISPDQTGQAARALMNFVKQQEGEEALRPLLDAMPGFRELVQ